MVKPTGSMEDMHTEVLNHSIYEVCPENTHRTAITSTFWDIGHWQQYVHTGNLGLPLSLWNLRLVHT